MNKKLTFVKPLINFVCMIALVLVLFPSTVSAFSGSGTGLSEDPYIITNCTQLQEMNDDLTANYRLANDIDCSATVDWNSGAGFLPIMGGDCTDPFTGALDGDGHTITDLFVNHNTEYGGCAGLFGWLEDATVSDLSLEDVSITAAQDYAGGLVGYASNDVTISNTFVSGTVTGQYYLGGLVGQFDGDPDDLITASGSTATITGESELGGLVGNSSVTITHSFATGDVSGYEFIGGLVGTNSGSISNTYAMGDASATGNDAGGLVGINTGTIANSYSIGTASAEINEGGLAGEDVAGTITDSFWDIETSGLASSAAGTGKTTAQMKNITTFTDAGWDFTTDWDINSTDNQGYPFFHWQTFSAPTDGDGISDAVEDAAPNDGDGNNDGTADNQQANVVSFVNTVTDKYSVLEVDSACTITDATVASETASATTDSGFDYPAGLMNFTINCGTPGFTATVTQYHYDLSNKDFVLRKYNPTTHAYFGINDASFAQTVIAGQTVTAATYEVTDGSTLDVDDTANGTIVDPAGLAVGVVGVPNTGLGGSVSW